MMRIKYIVTILLVICGRAWADPVKPTDGFLLPSNVSMQGILGDAIQISEKGRLMSLPTWKDGTLIKMFSVEARAKNNTTDWYGEHAGKWLYSTAFAVKRTGNEQLKQLLFSTADYLVSTQEADGYLGSYSPELRITNAKSKLHKKSWDVWSLSCTTMGLLQVNEWFPNEKYLGAAKKIGELLLKTFGPGAADITDYGTRYGYSATIVLDPVVELYKATGDKRYLDFAKLIVQKVEEREGLRMIAAMLNNRDLETVADGKAYQIIWNLVGLAKLYEVTGEADYLKAIENAWQNITGYHLTITGGPWGGIGKHKECFNTKNFWDPYGYIETCSTMSWIQLNKLLLHLTGDARYAQEIEKASYNALLGAQFPNGQDWSYHTFTNGRKHVANYNDCCPSSGVLALEELSPLIFTKRENGIACNLFTASNATIELEKVGQVRVAQKTNYPFEGKITLHVSSARKAAFPVFIRIPAWAANASITINGKPVTEQPIRAGSYYTLNRTWDKETDVVIDFPMPLQIVQKSEHAIVPQGTTDIYRVGWFSLMRGPLVYASNGLIDGVDREKNFHLTAANIESSFKPAGGQGYELTVQGQKPLLFLPYYEAGGRQAGAWRLTWMQYQID
jgi:DUF1680 family protein